ncbi:MAG TPA: hypothetical protein VKB75_03780 [Jatrophihabitans sp.]|nr:hypothetical protein [Jatrophihabitans sp.]
MGERGDPQQRDREDPQRGRQPAAGPGREEEPVLPSTTRDESDAGWGDGPSERDAEWYRRERPPHHE